MANEITRPFKGNLAGLSKDNNIVVNHPTTGRRVVADLSAASIGTKNGSTVSVVEYGDGVVNRTVLTLTNLPITVRDTQQGGGVKIYDFPAGRILTLGGSGYATFTTTSVLASTLNASVTCQWGVGSVTQTNTTLATTEQNLIQVTAFTSSATINVANTATNGVGAAVLASLDGTSTAIDAYFNIAVAGATDIDADATVLVNGVITLLWANAGDY